MCGRYALHSNPEVIALQFGLAPAPRLQPRYNIAPTQIAPVVRLGADEVRELAQLRWGLIPSWSNDPAIGARLINARAETIAAKPAFRDAFSHRRCLVPADGYYEWKKEGARKQPYLLKPESGGVFAMAGLWEQWRTLEGETTETFAVLTTDAAGAARRVHDRMPVILSPEDYEPWLNGPEPATLLRPNPKLTFTLVRVSTRVNSPRFDDPRCVEPEPGP
ncbi:MAG: SOS response-associated peptidase [Betaproteobacteria bacterium]|nr:SOS response-associated peptidase [Betaproteobacteria bacterium]MBI2961048.1 SOS response-associated peptidase [Betaproteobacteria bacterium]